MYKRIAPDDIILDEIPSDSADLKAKLEKFIEEYAGTGPDRTLEEIENLITNADFETQFVKNDGF